MRREVLQIQIRQKGVLQRTIMQEVEILPTMHKTLIRKMQSMAI